MFVVLTYDVGVRRTKRVMKICRRYLTHIQKSVFEGIITQSKLDRLKVELKKAIVVEEDSVQLYEFESLRYTTKEIIGLSKASDLHIL